MDAAQAYPINLTVDYPTKERDRLTVLFRMFTIIPILILLGLLMGNGNNSNNNAACDEAARTVAYGVACTWSRPRS